MKLTELKPGAVGRIVSFTSLNAMIRKKLLAFGILPDTEVRLIRFAPLGDPLQIRVRGCDVALRLVVAKYIDVALLDEGVKNDN